MENNKNKKSVKFQGDMLNFYDFIQVFVFTPNHHLKISQKKLATSAGDMNLTNSPVSSLISYVIKVKYIKVKAVTYINTFYVKS